MVLTGLPVNEVAAKQDFSFEESNLALSVITFHRNTKFIEFLILNCCKLCTQCRLESSIVFILGQHVTSVLCGVGSLGVF